MGKIFKAIRKNADGAAKLVAKFGDKAANAMKAAVKYGEISGEVMVKAANDMAKALKRVEGGNLSTAFKKMKTTGDEIFDDGFKSVLGTAEAAAKRAEDAAAAAARGADDVAGAAATAGKKGLLGSAADAASTGVKKISDACTSSAKAGAVCTATAGATVYAGVWWQQETKAGKKRSACRSLCMPKNTDEFKGTVFSEIGKDQLQFKTLEDVQEMFPEATSNTITDYPLCQDVDDINNLADCKKLCDTQCEESHPKSNLFESLVTDTAEVVGEAVGTAAGTALDTAGEVTGFKEFWKKNKIILIGIGAGIIGILILIAFIKISSKRGPSMPRMPRMPRMPAPPGVQPGFY